MLILILWIPASDHVANQARTIHTPYGREPSELLALVCEIGGFGMREQEQKAQVISKTANRTSTRFSVFVSRSLLIVCPLGS